MKTTVTVRGQTVVPAQIRKDYRIVPALGHMKVDTFGKRYLPTLLAMKLD